MGSFVLSKRSKSRREGVDSRMIEIDDLAITITLIDYGHPKYSGLRSSEIQNELYQKQASLCDGYINIGNHQKGLALDFYAYVDGKASWEPHHLAVVAAAYLQAASMLGYKLSWGGFWETDSSEIINGIPYGWDMGHVELVD